MDVRAIIVLGSSPEFADTTWEKLVGAPLAVADVLGKPVIFRIVDRLKASGVGAVAVITDTPTKDWPTRASTQGTWTFAAPDQLWRTVEQTFADSGPGGADVVLLIRVGAYADIPYSDFVQYHLERRRHVTCAIDGHGHPLDIYAIGGSRRNDGVYLVRHQLRKLRSGCEFYPFSGYVNHLTTIRDLRTLAIDALMQRVNIEPEGEQIKPGVWVGRGANIHRRARVLSPTYIGAGACVRAAAVVTRCSALEHHTVVDCGSVVENVSTLPYTYVGAGLDLAHAVVGHRRVWNLKRNVEVEFADARLIGEAPANAPLRVLGSLVSFARCLPAKLLRGIFVPSHRESPPSLPDAINAPAAALQAPAATMKASAPSVDAGEFPANLVIARRYGNE
jgi:carbonic anhydrase/acetyltransferase-like protein (isoleucine patch superfamily)